MYIKARRGLHQCVISVLALVQQTEGNRVGEHPKVAAAREASRERLAKQEAEESHAKEGLVKNAAAYLETFYQVRPRCQRHARERLTQGSCSAHAAILKCLLCKRSMHSIAQGESMHPGAALTHHAAEGGGCGMLQKRNTTKGQRSKENRQSADRLSGGTGPEGDTEWEKAISLINFGFSRPNGSDLSRFKNVLFAAKSRNVPIAGHTPDGPKA